MTYSFWPSWAGGHDGRTQKSVSRIFRTLRLFFRFSTAIISLVFCLLSIVAQPELGLSGCTTYWQPASCAGECGGLLAKSVSRILRALRVFSASLQVPWILLSTVTTSVLARLPSSRCPKRSPDFSLSFQVPVIQLTQNTENTVVIIQPFRCR